MKNILHLLLAIVYVFLQIYNIEGQEQKQEQGPISYLADCSTGLACPSGQYCNKGVCMPRPICREGEKDPDFYKNCREVSSGRCNNDAECEWGRVCISNQCQNQP